jgi:hypothetical protein
MPRTDATLRAIEKAQTRAGLLQAKHGGRRAKQQAQIEWYGKQLEEKVKVTAVQRIRIATELVKRKTKLNVSKPVLKYVGPKSKRVQVDPESRSEPGEFPRAETTHLMKTIFSKLDVSNKKRPRGIVGTPLDYGLRLETRMSRSFLRRTIHEESKNLKRILIKKWWKD